MLPIWWCNEDNFPPEHCAFSPPSLPTVGMNLENVIAHRSSPGSFSCNTERIQTFIICFLHWLYWLSLWKIIISCPTPSLFWEGVGGKMRRRLLLTEILERSYQVKAHTLLKQKKTQVFSSIRVLQNEDELLCFVHLLLHCFSYWGKNGFSWTSPALI